MPDEAVKGALNQGGMRGRRARGRQMVLPIDPKHAHTLPLTNGSILDHYRKNSSLCVFVCRGGRSGYRRSTGATLELKRGVCLT